MKSHSLPTDGRTEPDTARPDRSADGDAGAGLLRGAAAGERGRARTVHGGGSDRACRRTWTTVADWAKISYRYQG